MGGAFLYISAGAFCLGVAVALLFPVGFAAIVVALVLASATLAAVLLLGQPKFLLATIALASLALGAMRADSALLGERAETLPNYIGQKVTVLGRVTGDPDVRGTSVHVTLDHLSINGEPVSGKLLALLAPQAPVVYGDTIAISGALLAPQAFQTDTGHTFDYPGYLRAQGIAAQINYAKLRSDVPGGPSLLGMLFSLKHAFEHSLNRLFPEPDDSLLQGVLLGERHGISQALTNAFIASGLVHVVVLSGYNISIVSEGVFRALAFLPRSLNFGLGGALMILFALMSGASATTVRALAMALIALLARYLHRSALALRSLCVAASAMVLWNPESLLHDTSFILSVLATFGLITLSPWVESYLARLRVLRRPQLLATRSIIASTIAVQLFVLPVLLYSSGVLSLLAIPANALALPVIPPAMLLGFVAGLLGLAAPILGLIPAAAADLLLKWMLLVVSAVAAVPFGTIIIGQFSPWCLVALYIPLTWFAISRYKINSVSSSRAR